MCIYMWAEESAYVCAGAYPGTKRYKALGLQAGVIGTCMPSDMLGA